MAPEMFFHGPQTHKADVWSMFVTLAWVSNVRGFRQICECNRFESPEKVQQDVLFAADDKSMEGGREMAIPNPVERASAAQMLVKYFNGEGLSTPRHQVPALPNRP